MASLSLDIVILPTYNTYNMAVVDNSVYPTDPPSVTSPKILITVPTFETVQLDFVPQESNIFDSTELGITTTGNECPLPDGIYTFKYQVIPYNIYYVEKSIMRVEKLQEKFDQVFMQLDMMECDKAIKTQAKIQLLSIYFFIQGAIAAANNCANSTAEKLYIQADGMLNNMIAGNCGCSGTNFVINFQ